MPKRFDTIWISEPTRHDFSALKKYADNVQFLTSGFEKPEDISEIVAHVLRKMFDPATDAVVVAGKLYTALIVGKELGIQFPSDTLWLGIYVRTDNDKHDYKFVEVA